MRCNFLLNCSLFSIAAFFALQLCRSGYSFGCRVRGESGLGRSREGLEFTAPTTMVRITIVFCWGHPCSINNFHGLSPFTKYSSEGTLGGNRCPFFKFSASPPYIFCSYFTLIWLKISFPGSEDTQCILLAVLPSKKFLTIFHKKL